MFVDIDTPKAPLEVERIYNHCWRKGEEITPEVCMEVLRATNYAACVKRMLMCVERLPHKKQAGFKDVVLAAFTNREQPEEVVELGAKLAETGGYKDELEAVNGKIVAGKYLKSGAECTEYNVFEEENYEEHDFSRCVGAIFTGGQVNLGYAKNLPEDLDVSMCDKVDLRQCDLSSVKSLKFKEGAKVDLNYAKNLPPDLDVSVCGAVMAGMCDMAGVKRLKFKDGAMVAMVRARNLSADLDVSLCDYVRLARSDLSRVKSLTFKDGARVDLTGATHLPEELNFSGCADVDLDVCDIKGVKTLTFKNRKQMSKSKVKLPKDWEGVLIFTDEGAENKMSAAEWAIFVKNGGRIS